MADVLRLRMTNLQISLYPALVCTGDKKTPAPPRVLPPDNEPLIDLLTEEPPPYREPAAPQPAAPQPAAPQPAAPQPAAPQPAAPQPGPEEDPEPSPIAGRLRGRRDGPSGSSQALPLRTGNDGRLQYWPFSASDLYNWKNNNPSFSKDPSRLTSLIESVLVTHQPTWDDCQQLLQVLLTTEKRQRVILEARKHVPGDDGRPSQLLSDIDDAFPLERPEWNFATEDGRNHLRLYRQLLVTGLLGAGRRPTNLAQVKSVIQGPQEPPSTFLERLKEAYRVYTPYDPEDPTQATNLIMSFIWQSAPDIRRKLERLDNLRESSIQDILKEAEKVFNKRETPEEKEERLRKEAEERETQRDKKRNREFSKLLATVVTGQWLSRQGPGDKECRRPPVDHDQCAYCKEKGHWIKDCPNRPRGPRRPRPQNTLLNLED
ncbi:uncharacterized protein LOC114616118 [Grammomys surdaster]|uniref:uncharacterized protein LOC114616118 n=1 Tax=Grammomys surdaster TaxID=491861 RepID=UPI0010A0681D|nr:uncharacterized protein LOC114616118 [Grammomys surdaster]